MKNDLHRIYDVDVNVSAKVVYLYLRIKAGKRKETTAAYRTICEKAKIASKATVIRAIKELEVAGLLRREITRRSDGGYDANRYIFTAEE